MQYIQGKNRHQIQLFATCLDEMIAQDNSVRIIDIFVDSLDMAALDFRAHSCEGRPGYAPSDLLKLYIYGYMNRMRSSRHLEKECHRNIELIWLLQNLKPDHNTIARFRKDNAKAIKRVFQQTVSIAKNFNLIGGLLIAGDSTKLRAQNSKKNNYNQKKIERHLQYIENKLAEHQAALAQADGDKKEEIQQEISKQNQRKVNYHKLQNKLEESGDTQISTTDPESRHQITRNNITEVCYTLQTTIDDKHKIPIDYKITNENDKKAMGVMLRRAKSILRHNQFTALYDKGYHTGSEFKTAHNLGIETLVAIPAISRASQAPNPNYNVEQFTYHPDNDTYTCPQRNTLSSNGRWYQGKNYQFKQYKTTACKNCTVREQCTTAKQNGKIVQRSEYTPYIEQNAKRIAQNPLLYKRRQAIVEHPFGTIKRQWGFNHILTKQGKQRASADTGLMLIAYNLKRIINIIGVERLGKALQDRLTSLILHLSMLIKAFKRPFNHFGSRYSLFLEINHLTNNLLNTTNI